MRPINILVDEITPRLEYTCWQVFPQMLGWSFKLTTDREKFTTAEEARLCYASTPVDGAFHIAPAGLLRVKETIKDPSLAKVDGLPVIFPSQNDDLRFDLFSAVFFMLSRMEEYAKLELDKHGRPKSEQLWMVRHGLIERPLVDQWVLHFAQRLRTKFPQLPEPVREFKAATSMDIDNGFMYLGRSWWRTLGSISRDILRGNMTEVDQRIKVLKGDRPDPYDIYSKFIEELSTVPGRKLAFVLVGDRSKNDHAVGLGCSMFRKRLGELQDVCEIGVHPSYRSSDRSGMIKKECDRLASVIGEEVSISRQHFLRCKLPRTYRELETLGVKEDHSMGLADHVGFRAGTCTPFKWYDLEQERESKLELWPLVVMDSTMSYKMKLTPEQAIEKTLAMIRDVRQVGGTFSCLWHERFLSEHGPEQGWSEVFLRTMKELRQ